MNTSAVLAQQVARLPFQVGDAGSSPSARLHFTPVKADECAPLLAAEHYLGPIGGASYGYGGWVDDVLVACQLYRSPTARMMNDPDRLELVRWCLTPAAGKNAGSRMMAWVARQLRKTTARQLISYSELDRHTGALYRASGWIAWPTHHADRYMANGVGYPSGHGSWDGVTVQRPKMRWRFEL